jgi:large subunit ribosomal protein L7Ae
MGVPYVIVKGKARLGTVVHKKTAAVVTLQDVKSEDQKELATLVSASKANLYVFITISLRFFVWLELIYFLSSRSSDKYEEQRRQWGGGLRGNKSTQMLRKRAKAAGQNTSIGNFNKL